MPKGIYKRTAEMKTGKYLRTVKMRANMKKAQNRSDVNARRSVSLTGNPKMIAAQIERYKDPKEHEKTSVTVKEALNKPDVKKKHKESLNKPEVKAANSVAHIKLWQDPVYRENQIAAIKEAHNTPEYLESISGINNVHYIDGLSNIYHLNFNESFRQKIRDRDVVCQICGKTCEQNINEIGKSLSVHHIYYDPETNDCLNDEDFITLCNLCHQKTTVGNHEYWINYFIMQKLLVA